ncbi:MAG TPA: flagellar biosynthetic protein FliO [Novosphingobium sp.]|nr:flagellar biosynthetic protein FliO [Novosphingobium sp.]
MLGALSVVLGGLTGALWLVRRHGLTLPARWLERLGPGPERRLRVVERLAIDQRRSVVLLRRDDTEFSVMIGPEGAVVLDSNAAPVIPKPVVSGPSAPEPAADSFASKIPVLPEVWFAQEPANDRARDVGGFH